MRRYFILAGFLLFSNFSTAGLSFEPYLGTGIGGFYLKNTTTYTGWSLGSRMGYSRWGMMLGVDASYISYEPFESFQIIDPTDGVIQTAKKGISQLKAIQTPKEPVLSSASANPYNVFTMGPVAVFGLPLIIDAYASAMWAAASNKKEKLQGMGLKLGMSYLSLPFFSVNIEVQAINYFSCYSIAANKACPSNTENLGQMYMMLIYVSSPINTGLL